MYNITQYHTILYHILCFASPFVVNRCMRVSTLRKKTCWLAPA